MLEARELADANGTQEVARVQAENGRLDEQQPMARPRPWVAHTFPGWQVTELSEEEESRLEFRTRPSSALSHTAHTKNGVDVTAGSVGVLRCLTTKELQIHLRRRRWSGDLVEDGHGTLKRVGGLWKQVPKAGAQHRPGCQNGTGEEGVCTHGGSSRWR